MTLQRNSNILRKYVDILGHVDTRTMSPIHSSALAFIQLDRKFHILKQELK